MRHPHAHQECQDECDAAEARGGNSMRTALVGNVQEIAAPRPGGQQRRQRSSHSERNQTEKEHHARARGLYTLLIRHVLSPLAAVRHLLWAASCAVFLLLLSSLVRLPDVPAPVAATLFAFALFATYRPAPALLAVAALVPIATWTGRQWNGSVAWPETIVIAYLAGYAARKTLEHD